MEAPPQNGHPECLLWRTPARPAARLARALCALALLLASPAAPAQFIIDSIPGGLAEIPLAPLEQEQPKAYFGQRRLLVTEFARRWVALVGLPLDLVPGTYVLQLDTADSEALEAREFTVFPRRREGSGEADLPGPPAELNAPDLSWREPLQAGLPLQSPVDLPAKPVFGRHRPASRTGEARAGRADFVAFTVTRDSTVRAPQAGTVAALATHKTGVYLWIDHGMSLYTRLGPLSSAAAAPSATLRPGQPIGRILLDEDETPRELYLAVYLNGTAINPFLIFELDAPGDDRLTGGR